MFACSASLRWPLLLAVALLLSEQSQLALSATFHLTARSPPSAARNGQPYSAVYDLLLTGNDSPCDPGIHLITGVSGTRTYDNGSPDGVRAVNVLSYYGFSADDLLYFGIGQNSNAEGGYLDFGGLGQTSSAHTPHAVPACARAAPPCRLSRQPAHSCSRVVCACPSRSDTR